MANILTATEAANVLRCETTDANMLALLPLVDAYVKNATGRKWEADSPIRPEAKNAARMLLVMMHEDPGRIATGGALNLALTAAFIQLEVIALKYHEIEGQSGAGYIYLHTAREGDVVASVIGLSAGWTGDQSALFESVVSRHHHIHQVSNSNLDECFFRVELTPLSEQ